VRLLHQLADRLRVCRAAYPRVKTAIRAVIAHRGQVVIAEAVFEDTFNRFASKALKFEIGPGEVSGPLRCPALYWKEDVEMRVDLLPDLLDFNNGRISADQVAGEKARLFRQVIGRKLTIHASTGDCAIMRCHTDDRASLVVLLQGFEMPEGGVEFCDGRAARFEVVQKLRPLIVDQSCVLPATSDHPLDRGHLPVKQRSWPRFAQRINHIGYALRFLYNWIEAGE